MESTGISMIDHQLEKLAACLQKDLPGASAQSLMRPSVHPDDLLGNIGSSAKSRGVLILLFPGSDGISTVFILRTQGGLHGGQISLPGGKQEASDKDLVQTALRESYEEIGVDPKSVSVLGLLSPLFVPYSNFIIQPVVGAVTVEPLFIPEPIEVADIIVVPLKQLFARENHKTTVIHRAGKEIVAPFYEASGKSIWGATAMIMSELEQLLISCICE